MSKPGKWPSTGFGEQLRSVRAERGLTQKELAEQVGVHAMTIYHLETGLHEPALPLAIALAQVLEVGLLDLFFNGHPPVLKLPLSAVEESPKKARKKKRKE